MKITHIAIATMLTVVFSLGASNAFAGYGKHNSHNSHGKHSSYNRYGKHNSYNRYGKHKGYSYQRQQNKRADRIEAKIDHLEHKLDRLISKPIRNRRQARRVFHKAYFVLRSITWWKLRLEEIGGGKPSPS